MDVYRSLNEHFVTDVETLDFGDQNEVLFSFYIGGSDTKYCYVVAD